jgi:hypothetical protein
MHASAATFRDDADTAGPPLLIALGHEAPVPLIAP